MNNNNREMVDIVVATAAVEDIANHIAVVECEVETTCLVLIAIKQLRVCACLASFSS